MPQGPQPLGLSLPDRLLVDTLGGGDGLQGLALEVSPLDGAALGPRKHV